MTLNEDDDGFEDEDKRIGTTLLGKLRVDGLLGQGGMGAVYRVHHLVTKHDRALKVLHASFAGDEEIYKRLLREAGVAGTLKSDHVVETFDVGRLEDGSPYVLMELMKGEPLADRMERDLTTKELVGFVCQAIEGVAQAHAAGIIHRDIKPDNLFVVDDGRGGDRVKLLDFGISKFRIDPLDEGSGTLTKQGAVMGTPLYMSPEQAIGKAIGPETDLYSLGVILYEGLSGRRPHEAETFPEFLLKLHTVTPKPLSEIAPHVDPGLAAVVDKALSIEVTDRHRTAHALLRDLLPFTEMGKQHLETISGVPHATATTEPAAAPDLGVIAKIESTPRAKRPPEPEEAEPPAKPAVAERSADSLSIEPTIPRPAWMPWAVIGGAVAVLAGAAVAMSGGGEPDPPEVTPPVAEAPADPEPTPEEPPDAPAPEEATVAQGVDEPPIEEPDPPPTTTPATRRGRRPAKQAAEPTGTSGGRFEIGRDNPYD